MCASGECVCVCGLLAPEWLLAFDDQKRNESQ